MSKEEVKDIKKDIKRETKSILNMLLSSSKAVFFKFILGKFIKQVCKKNSVDLEALSKLDPASQEFLDKTQETLNLINEHLTVVVEEELSFILKSKVDYRQRNNLK